MTVRSTAELDGHWSVSVELPDDFPAGETTAGIDNWNYSSCPDNASCAGPVGSFRVEAPTPTP